MVSWKLRYQKGISILQGLSDSKSKGLGKKIKTNTKKLKPTLKNVSYKVSITGIMIMEMELWHGSTYL